MEAREQQEQGNRLLTILRKARELVAEGWTVREAVYESAVNSESDSALMLVLKQAGLRFGDVPLDEALSIFDRAIEAQSGESIPSSGPRAYRAPTPAELESLHRFVQEDREASDVAISALVDEVDRLRESHEALQQLLNMVEYAIQSGLGGPMSLSCATMDRARNALGIPEVVSVPESLVERGSV